MSYTYPLARTSIEAGDVKMVMDVLTSGCVSSGGWNSKYVKLLEWELREAVHARGSVVVSSGTAGLELALAALELPPRSKILTTPLSFVASTFAIINAGHEPVFGDVDGDLLLDIPNGLLAHKEKDIKAVLGVDLFGRLLPTEYTALLQRRGTPLIEDACQALGSWNGRNPVGERASYTVFSFWGNKQCVGGELGAVTTHAFLHGVDKIRQLANQGRVEDGDWFDHTIIGTNRRADEMSAALAYSQLQRLSSIVSRREELAQHYYEQLNGGSVLGVRPLPRPAYTVSHFTFPVLVPPQKRDAIQKHLDSIGIQTRAYFPLITKCPALLSQFRHLEFPAASNASASLLCLPFYSGLGKTDIEHIVQCLLTAVKCT